jgi:putative flippase GtrA
VRFTVFLVVGWFGFALQLSVLAFLTSVAHWPWLPATIVAVELAVVHNFLWHERVTWRDRHNGGFKRFARFNVATGITSIAGNVMLMAAFIGLLGLRPVAANVLAVATMSVVNFFVSDRWVFAIALVCLSATGASAAQRSETIEAWNRYVAETETRVEATVSSPRSVDRELRAEGESIGVPSGTISRWRGSIFVPGADLDQVLSRLQYPGTAPPQEDVVSSRVLARGPDSLRVSIQMVRHAIITVTYDTEHEMAFRRRTPTLATARSVATRIDEVGGADRGFLWRLNSYWRYEQVDGGVRIDLESLTLSRDVPTLVRPIASPIVSRIARESMVRTLDALGRYLDPAREPKPCPAALPGKTSQCS